MCVAKESYIRLCQHEVIRWDDIQPYVTSGSRHRCEVIKVCKHASHSVACCRQDSCPTATVWADSIAGERVVIVRLSWQPHLGPNLSPGPLDSQQYRATEIRSITRRLRADAAQYIAPELRLGHLPEMECFSKNCDCLLYDGLDKSSEANSDHKRLSSMAVDDPHVRRAANGMKIRPCFRMAVLDKLPCLVFQYDKAIFSCHSLGGPDHQWFHALDPASYEYSGLVGARETCVDAACRNHFRVTVGIPHHHNQTLSRTGQETITSLRFLRSGDGNS